MTLIERETLLDHVTREAAPWIRELGRLASDYPQHILEVRGMGFLVGIQMASDSAPYANALRERGLLTALAGVNVIRLLPPLNASGEELARSVADLQGGPRLPLGSAGLAWLRTAGGGLRRLGRHRAAGLRLCENDRAAVDQVPLDALLDIRAEGQAEVAGTPLGGRKELGRKGDALVHVGSPAFGHVGTVRKFADKSKPERAALQLTVTNG